jgi:hypothetical protein
VSSSGASGRSFRLSMEDYLLLWDENVYVPNCVWVLVDQANDSVISEDYQMVLCCEGCPNSC